MRQTPAIVIVAYNRPGPLYRLLSSVASGFYEGGDVPLVISLDKSDSEEVKKIAENFDWKFGPKRIIQNAEHLGLKEHILRCGDLSSEYGSVIILEDDLLVSPWFYHYASQALKFYASEKSVSGISLYNYQVAESCFYSFQAIDDGTDVYFMQVASSWGQAWTNAQWKAFRDWFTKNPDLTVDGRIPEYIKKWGLHSWKKHFIHYLIDTGTYFVFPRLSLTTNFEEPGTNAITKRIFQVPLQSGLKEYLFCDPSDSGSRYDAWFEPENAVLKARNNKLQSFDFDTDLYGVKEKHALKKPYVLTSRLAHSPLLSFSSHLFPLENNVALDLSGSSLSLYKVEGNEFSEPQTYLKRLIDEKSLHENELFSVAIVLTDFNEAELSQTLAGLEDPVEMQMEVIIAAKQKFSAGIEKLLSYSSLKIKVVLLPDQVSRLDLIKSAIVNCRGMHLVWLSGGSSISAPKISLAALLFRQHPTINWVRGIEHAYSLVKPQHIKPYRLIPGSAYRRYKTEDLDVSTELHLFNRYALNAALKDAETESELFFGLMANNQLFVADFSTGIRAKPSNVLETLQQKEQTLVKFKNLDKPESFKLKLIHVILSMPFINSHTRNWFYAAYEGYPDVLRYDAGHGTFYFSKY